VGASRRFPRDPLGDGVTTARYDPHTLLLWHRQGAMRQAQRLGIKAYEGLNHRKPWVHVDLEGSDAPVDLIAAFHEQTHWIQFSATSIGALLTTIRLYQHAWVRLELPHIAPAVRDAAVKRRRAGRAIFEVDADYGLVRDDLAEDWREMGETWWEHEVAYQFLLGRVGSRELQRHDRARAISGVLGYIAHSAVGGGGDERELYLALTNAFGSSEWNLLDTARCGLTTEQLFEGGAVVGELRTLAAARAAGIRDRGLDQRRRERIASIPTDPYFAAVRVFCEHLGFDPAVIVDDEDVRRGFLVVLDLALNPPVPPFISREVAARIAAGPPGGALSIKQLYPPLRFLSLCLAFKALLDHRQAGFPADHEQTAELQEKLCYVTQLVATSALPEPWELHQAHDFTLLEDDLPALRELRLLDYVRTVQQQLWRLRGAHPGFSTDHLDAVVLDDDADRSKRRLLAHYGGIVEPLIQMGRMGKGRYALLPAPGLEQLQQALLAKSAFEYLLPDIFCGVGELSLGPFPAAFASNEGVQERLLAEYARYVGEGAGLAFGG
jgi:hypothetical protein